MGEKQRAALVLLSKPSAALEALARTPQPSPFLVGGGGLGEAEMQRLERGDLAEQGGRNAAT